MAWSGARAPAPLRLLLLLLLHFGGTLASAPTSPPTEGTAGPPSSPGACSPTEYRCSTGVCIPLEWRCDGDTDCRDGADEVQCWSQPCRRGELRCYQPACRNGSTEPSCLAPVCLAKERFCDGVPDCPDGADEHGELCQRHPTHPPPQKCLEQDFQCAQGMCIPDAWRCDGHPDCDDEKDEEDCGEALDISAPTDASLVSIPATHLEGGSQIPPEKRGLYGVIAAAAVLSTVLVATFFHAWCRMRTPENFFIQSLLRAIKGSLTWSQ
uniref:CD320 molecule n=1 Tax=Ornithorhynchus anatinus TaxID=9258 RepID=A0A6I8N2Z1_ORNAN